jgi:parallel beta-helix repeat protein
VNSFWKAKLFFGNLYFLLQYLCIIQKLVLCVMIDMHKSGRRSFRGVVLVVSVLVLVLISSLFVYLFVVNNAEGSIHVKDETELRKAVDKVDVGKSVVITLDRNIVLTCELKIPMGKNITLTSKGDSKFFKLVGADGWSTLAVEAGGVLELKGIIVTHAEDAVGHGVDVYYRGILTMSGGELSGNRVTDSGRGGGVFNGGQFSLLGGTISGNTADISGGGVLNLGVFEMLGGMICNNIATGGGGIYNGNEFRMSGGEISGNTAHSSGGGLYTVYSDNFSLTGGTISGNTASFDSDIRK